MATENKSISKKIMVLFLAAAVTFSLIPNVIGNGIVHAAPVESNQADAPKSEAITTHEPQTYVFDYRESIGNRLTKGNGEHIYGTGNPRSEWDLLPILLPGDKVKIIPDLPTVEYALEHGKTSVGVAGLVFYDRTAESKEPSVKVTKAVSYGSPSDGNGSSFIQEFEITGTEPVMVVITGGTNGYTLEKKTVRVNETDVQVTLAYAAEWLTIKRFPEYINLNYQFFDENDNLMDDPGVVYYGETENPDAIWAVDAIYNIKAEEKASFKINRPYAEGYRIVFDAIYRDSRAYNWPLNTEFDETDTMTVTPRWGANDRTVAQGSGAVVMVSSYEDDWTNVKYFCYHSPTLTLDTCGGTINGFASRIYEINNYSDRYYSLEEDEAEGLYTPVRDGYIFDGWYTDKDYSNKVVSVKAFWDKCIKDSEKSKEYVFRLYAKWLRNAGWSEEDGKRYYCDEPGVPHTGWLQDAGKWYYLDSNGVMQTGWVEDAGKKYYLDSDGVMKTGWIQDAGKWYYLSASGAMAAGWVKSGNDWYYLDASGAMVTGWLKWNNKWYYLTPGNGNMATGWKQISGKWYYLKPSGVMASLEYVKGYWLNADGSWTYQYVASWKHDSKGWWYGDNSGWYAKNGSFTIDGKQYDFDASGYCTNP